jgi:hypothetical protein
MCRRKIVQIEGRQHFWHEGRHRPGRRQPVAQPAGGAGRGQNLRVVVIREREQLYGVAVERLIGERVLVVMPLDPRLGKVQDISSGALLDDGSVVLIVDVEDLLRSVDKLLSTGRLERIERGGQHGRARASGCWWSTTRSPCASCNASCWQPWLRRGRGGRWHGRLERPARRGLRLADHRHRHAAHGRYRTGHPGAPRPAPAIVAGDGGVLQGP